MYKLKILSCAQKDYDKLRGKIFEQITTKILKLKKAPRPPGCKKLTKEEGYRIRVRSFRILYRIDDTNKEIFIYRIKQRSKAYK